MTEKESPKHSPLPLPLTEDDDYIYYDEPRGYALFEKVIDGSTAADNIRRWHSEVVRAVNSHEVAVEIGRLLIFLAETELTEGESHQLQDKLLVLARKFQEIQREQD